MRSALIPNSPPNHALIVRGDEYMIERQFISFHSEDIDNKKYPNSSEFEIQLPQDYLNVRSISLSSFDFPKNINNFSAALGNVTISFLINKPYMPVLPGDAALYNLLLATYNALSAKNGTNGIHRFFVATIADGNYFESNLPIELMNRMNYAVTVYLAEYFAVAGLTQEIVDLNAAGGYTGFIVINNEVSNIISIGNTSSGFLLANNNDSTLLSELGIIVGILGEESISTSNLNDLRFFWAPGTSGIWLTPAYSSPVVYYLQGLHKWNPMSSRYYIYMEIDAFNCMDETSISYSNSNTNTNKNGVVKAAFAKIPIYTCTSVPAVGNVYFNDVMDTTYKFFNPPAVRIRKIKVRLRYHDNHLVSFGGLPFTFTLLLEMLLPQKMLNA